MNKLLTICAAGIGALGLTGLATAQTAPPAEVPFPAPKSDVFVFADTITTPTSKLGASIVSNYFGRGETVAFRAFAADLKTGRTLTGKDVTYFYVKIPSQPNVKLKYASPGSGAAAIWSGTWTIPTNFALGTVAFKVLIKTTAKRYGSFVQAPVAPAMLTVTF